MMSSRRLSPGPRETNQKVVVIGAGPAGLASALLLASRGYKVELLEKNSGAGGKMQEIRAEGFRFDTGPSLLTMPGIINRVFEIAGVPETEIPELVEMHPLCRYFYPDGVTFDAYQDLDKTIQEIRRFSPEDIKGYRDFLDYSATLYERTADAFLFNPLYEWSDLIRLHLPDLLRIDSFRSVSDAVDRFVTSTYLRMFFKRFSTYNGSTPFRAPATLNVIPHVELTLGGYYVRGGLYRLVSLLEEKARSAGVEFRYNCTVNKIDTREGKVVAVETVDGDRTETGIVLSNADASVTLGHMLDPVSRAGWRDWMIRRQELSSSGFVLMLGCDRKWNQLSHHNIFFSNDYSGEFRRIFEDRGAPLDPTIYVTNTSITDPEDAPAGGSNLFVLINVPWLADDSEWSEANRSKTESLLISILESRGLKGLSESIRYREMITPVEFASRYGSSGGSIYGSSSNSRLSAFLRHGNKVREVEGLYLASGSAHPGGGIPLVLLSALHAVELIQRYEQ